jgi:hypothetical protein
VKAILAAKEKNNSPRTKEEEAHFYQSRVELCCLLVSWLTSSGTWIKDGEIWAWIVVRVAFNLIGIAYIERDLGYSRNVYTAWG